jgi:cytochrome P450 family 138
MRNCFEFFTRVYRAIRNRVWFRIKTLVQLWGIRLRAVRDRLPPLPPGRLGVNDHGYWKGDLFLLHQSRRFGPVFKTNISGQLVTCVVDHRRSRAILNENVQRLEAVKGPYNGLVSGGFLRCQTGELHRTTRRIFTRALHHDLVQNNDVALRQIVQRELSIFASACETRLPYNDEFLRTLDRIATAMLLLLFFGVRFGEPAFATLLSCYARLGPKGFVWEVGLAQQEAFADLAANTHRLITDLQLSAAGRAPSVLLELVGGQVAAAIDENVVGNLIYMVEMGRYDLYSLFHWITKHLSDNPPIVAEISTEERAAPDTVNLAMATVLETLRVNQAEAVVRRVVENITFDGWGIPKGGFLRACIREGHRDPAVFPNPDQFDPQRFMGRKYGPAEYSPFGFDHHHCIASDLVIQLGSIFVEELVHSFYWQVLADGPCQRGTYHWTPSGAFAIRLMPHDSA